jgi:hypothetical protein
MWNRVRVNLTFILILLSADVLAREPIYDDDQVCDVETRVTVVNNANGTSEESSVKMVKCNDNKIQRLFQVQSGMAPNCGEFTYWMKIGGRDVQRKGVSCQKLDGSWEIVNTAQLQ